MNESILSEEVAATNRSAIQTFRSILDFDLDDHKGCKNIQGRLNSPKSIQAMQILGLTAEELKPVSIDYIKEFYIKRDRKTEIPKDLINLRYKMLDERRHTKKNLIIQERNKLIEAEHTMMGMTSTTSRQSKQFQTIQSTSMLSPKEVRNAPKSQWDTR